MEFTVNLTDISNTLFTTHATTWLLVVVLAVVGLAASVIVEVIKRKRTAKQQIELANKTIAWLLTALTTVFTLVGYLIFFLQTNTTVFNAFPFLARHVPQVLGVLWFVYQLRLNRWYKALADKYGKKARTGVPAVDTSPDFPA